jgi:hypothetical protein
MKQITLHESDFAVNSFAYHELCECFDIYPDEDTCEYPEMPEVFEHNKI